MASARPLPEPTQRQLHGRLTFAGSTTIQPLIGQIGKQFLAQNPSVELEIAAGGSVVGIEAVHNGTADIGMSSRNLHPTEAEGITQHPIANDVLAVIVHPTNPITALSVGQLRAMYVGEITNWSAVGGPNMPIHVVVREQSSGTRGAFDELVLGEDEPAAEYLEVAITAGDAANLVAIDPAAVAYVGFGNIEPILKTVAIEGISPSVEHVRNGTYRLVRPLILLTGPLTQPLAHDFIAFVRSLEGQRLIEEDGWVPYLEP